MFPGGEGGQCVGLTTLPPSCADCLKIWEPQPPGTFKACNGIALPKVIIRGPDSGARACVCVQLYQTILSNLRNFGNLLSG